MRCLSRSAWSLALATSLLVVLVKPQCDMSFPDHEIGHILSNTSSSSVYYLGHNRDNIDIASAAECKSHCVDLNYICDAGNKRRFTYLEGSSSFTVNDNKCRLDLEGKDTDWGSWLLLTPDIVAEEYVIELNMRILTGEEAGIAFAASQSPDPTRLVYANIDLQNGDAYVGWLGDGYVTINNIDVLADTDYTLRVHKLSDGHFVFYLDDVLIWSSSLESHKITAAEFPHNFAGFYAWKSNARANWLKLTFPSSPPETVCSGYTFNSNTSECYGYYGVEYAALYDTLSANATYDSGILSPTCPPTNSPVNVPTASSEIPTESPISVSSNVPSNSPTISPTVAPTRSTTTTKRPTLIVAHSSEPSAQSPFVNPTSSPTDAPVDGEDGENSVDGGTLTPDEILVVVAVFMAVAAGLVCGWMYYRRLKKMREQSTNQNDDADKPQPICIQMDAKKKPHGNVISNTNSAKSLVHNSEMNTNKKHVLTAQATPGPNLYADDEEEDDENVEELFDQYDEEETDGNQNTAGNTAGSTTPRG